MSSAICFELEQSKILSSGSGLNMDRPIFIQLARKNNCNMFCDLQYKIWLKPSAEQQFLYGHHVMKSGLGRITENTEQYQGVIVYNMADLPLVSGWSGWG